MENVRVGSQRVGHRHDSVTEYTHVQTKALLTIFMKDVYTEQ